MSDFATKMKKNLLLIQFNIAHFLFKVILG